MLTTLDAVNRDGNGRLVLSVDDGMALLSVLIQYAYSDGHCVWRQWFISIGFAGDKDNDIHTLST